ncbi:antibiotic biosynthesis monooxygenase [Dokdonella sp.]|uniref:putative quinol monooxygenase n=1 Tax=Dokdonella sp. TaxID=2291710 RepID=UPI001B0501A5|nr:antibiotic biosynthesis monooxygenase [Dokdonella sp.]MBO9661345.1 antibiotic biosynthesis monooxygenase [Dokdonella sp.]
MTQLHLVAVLYAKPGREALLRTRLGELVEPLREANGSVRYELLPDERNPRRFVLAERRAKDRGRSARDAEDRQMLAFEAMHWDGVERVEGYRLGQSA